MAVRTAVRGSGRARNVAGPSRDPTVRRAARALYGLLALGLAVAGASTLVYTILLVYRFHVVLPYADEWAMTYDIERIIDRTYGVSFLAAQYNEHRLLVPRLFFFIDDFVFGGSDRFDIAVMFAFQAISAGVLIACVRGQARSLASRSMLVGLVLLALFSLRQAENFTFGFQLQFTGVFAFAILAIPPFLSGLRRLRAGERGARTGAWLRVGLAYALCAAATYTMANGSLAAPTLFVLSLLLRAPKRLSVATAAVSGALAALYFHGLTEMGLGLSAAAALADPLAYPRFVAALLGNVVGIVGVDLAVPGVDDPFVAAEAFGSAALAALAGAAWIVARGRARTPGSPVLLGIMGFTAASACATAYGRAGVGPIEAFEGRYVEISVLFWSAAVLFWFPYAGRARAVPLAVGAALGTAVAVLVAALGVAEIRAPHAIIARAATHRTLRDALLSGFIDPRAIRHEIWTADVLARPVAILRAARQSLFAGPEAEERGEPVDAVGAVAPDPACTGSVSAEADPTLGPGGVRVSGLAWDAARDRPVARILTVGPDGRVSGFGSLDRPVGTPRRWTGYATAASGASVSAYAVLADGRLCRLGAAAVADR